jgi:hypothetical protein
MTTLTQMVALRRGPLSVRWEVVTDVRGRPRPQMRWEPAEPTTSAKRPASIGDKVPAAA